MNDIILGVSKLLGNLSAVMLLLVAVGIYLLPTIVGFFRKKRNLPTIVLVNVLLGWTIIGWGAMIVEAFKNDNAP